MVRDLMVAASFVIGLLIGSFLNVVVWRVPRGESLVSPGSHCPTCDVAIRWFDNVPVVSWLLLRGRCRNCGEGISLRYPVVELVTAVLFALTAWRFMNDDWTVSLVFQLIAYLYLAAISIALTLIDIEHHRLPNSIVLPSVVVSLLLFSASAVFDGVWTNLIRATIGGLVLFAAYFLMMVVYPAGMGFGDVKLAAVLGIYLGWLGWGALVVGSFAAFVLGGIFSGLLMLAGKATRKSGIPFGPWMVAGAALGIAAGETMWAAYLKAFAG